MEVRNSTRSSPGWWPRTGRRFVGEFERADRDAEFVHDHVSDAHPMCLAERLGISVRFCDLEASSGGLQALLLPRTTGFEILCDPWAHERPEDVMRLRIAHELAHTFFYDWGSPRPTYLPDSRSMAEERFCDRFASSLVGYSIVAATVG